MTSLIVFTFVVALPVRTYFTLKVVFTLVASTCGVVGVPFLSVSHWPGPAAADFGVASVAQA